MRTDVPDTKGCFANWHGWVGLRSPNTRVRWSGPCGASDHSGRRLQLRAAPANGTGNAETGPVSIDDTRAHRMHVQTEFPISPAASDPAVYRAGRAHALAC